MLNSSQKAIGIKLLRRESRRVIESLILPHGTGSMLQRLDSPPHKNRDELPTGQVVLQHSDPLQEWSQCSRLSHRQRMGPRRLFDHSRFRIERSETKLLTNNVSILQIEPTLPPPTNGIKLL